jgi:hypothetical protein
MGLLERLVQLHDAPGSVARAVFEAGSRKNNASEVKLPVAPSRQSTHDFGSHLTARSVDSPRAGFAHAGHPLPFARQLPQKTHKSVGGSRIGFRTA